jgi:hypothetical protein
MVYEFVGKKYACVNLTKISPLTELRVETSIVEQLALKATSSKVAKHEKTCFDNQHTFISCAFDTFGFLALEIVNVLQSIQNVMNNNVVSHNP